MRLSPAAASTLRAAVPPCKFRRGAAFTIAAAPSAYLLAVYCRHQEIERIITARAHDFWLDNQHL
jgi:hypothetical protein